MLATTTSMPDRSQHRGIIYVATGEKHLQEALISARQAAKLMPDLSLSIFTDQAVPEGLFDHVYPAATGEMGRRAKIRAMLESPYEQTLYLDTDTYICQPCEDIFWVLERFDLAVAHEVYRNEYKFEEFPGSFPSFNTGVVVFNKNPLVSKFLSSWEESYETVFSKKRKADQPAFRHTLFHSKVNFYVLPTEYNFRTNYPVVLGGFASVKILHDRSPCLEELAELLGHDTSHPPLYFGPVHVKFFLTWCRIRLKTLAKRAQSLGLTGTLKRVFGRKSAGWNTSSAEASTARQ